MKRKVILIQFISIAVVATTLGQGLVSQPKQRAELLEGIDAILGRRPISALVSESGRRSPFLAVAAQPAPVRVAESGNLPPVVVAPVPRLSDEAALGLAARSFKPSGSLITSTRRVLRLDNGSMVNEGHVFSITIRGERYRVILDSVSEDGYVLRVGDAMLKRSFIEADERAKRVGGSPQ